MALSLYTFVIFGTTTGLPLPLPLPAAGRTRILLAMSSAFSMSFLGTPDNAARGREVDLRVGVVRGVCGEVDFGRRVVMTTALPAKLPRSDESVPCVYAVAGIAGVRPIRSSPESIPKVAVPEEAAEFAMASRALVANQWVVGD